MQKAPTNTKRTPNKDTWLLPKGSAEIIIPKKPKNIARILIILIFSFRMKCDITSNIKGDVNNTGQTTDKGSFSTPIRTKKKPKVWMHPRANWNL